MRILGITDLHGRYNTLQNILADAGRVDLVLLGGDITDFGSPEDVEALVRLAQESGAEVLAVAGNCDSAAIDRRLVELGVSLHGRGVVYQGVGLQGLSAMPPWLGHMYQFTEEELAEFLQAGYEQLDGLKPHVVLSHPPPHRAGKLDRTRLRRHVGSRAVRDFVERTRPALVLCGHIHEGRGIDEIGTTVVVNCGVASSGHYALADVGTEPGDEVNVELHRA